MEKLSEEVPWASSATRRLRDLSSLTEQDREKRWLEFPKPSYVVDLFLRCLLIHFCYSPTENGLLDYYCIDLASLLPVLALDIQDFEQVLDMCAGMCGREFVTCLSCLHCSSVAPGGKTLAILQKSRRLNLTINDPSQERRKDETILQRLSCLHWCCSLLASRNSSAEGDGQLSTRGPGS